MKKLLLLCTLSILSYAVPAYQGNITFKQADGTTFNAHLKGDEYFSWIEDKIGHIIIYNKMSKNYEYAKFEKKNGVQNLIPSGIKIGNNTPNYAPSLSKDTHTQEILSEIWKRKREKRKYTH